MIYGLDENIYNWYDMTIKKKVERIISKGGDVASDKEPKKYKSVLLRIPADFLNLINEEVKKRVGLNRNAWILEAMQEKRERQS